MPTFQASLLEDAVQCSRRHIEVRLACYCYGPWFRRVPELAMATLGSNQPPAVLLDHLNNISKFHATDPQKPGSYDRESPSARLEHLFRVELGDVDAAHGLAQFFRALRNDGRFVVMRGGADNGLGAFRGVGGLENP